MSDFTSKVAIRKTSIAVRAKSIGERTVRARVSTPDVDRDGDVIVPTGVDLSQYTKNPVVLFGHRYQELPVGRSERVWATSEGVFADIAFAPTSEGTQAYDLAVGGFLSAWSVGIMPLQVEPISHPNGRIGQRYVRSELLEISAVPVPSNPYALTMSKALRARERDEAVWKWASGGMTAAGWGEHIEHRKLRARVERVVRELCRDPRIRSMIRKHA